MLKRYIDNSIQLNFCLLLDHSKYQDIKQLLQNKPKKAATKTKNKSKTKGSYYNQNQKKYRRENKSLSYNITR